MKRLLIRSALVALALELAMTVATYVRGFPALDPGFGTPSFWEELIALIHGPAVTVLALRGVCCGWESPLVLSDVVVDDHFPMTLLGSLVLSVTNLLVWFVAVAALTWLWRNRRRHAA